MNALNLPNPEKRILGMGNALVDLIFPIESDSALKELHLPKGSMTLIDAERAEHILHYFRHTELTVATGGSASNTIAAIAALGGECGFIGRIGRDDRYGKFYIEDIKSRGIRPHFSHTDIASGTAITLVSPDSERTFATFLGAAATLEAEHLTPDCFEAYQYFHIEGYMVQNYSLMEKAVALAKAAHMMISLDLASYNIVQEHTGFIRKILPEADIVFANEEEARALTGKDNLEALAMLSENASVAIVKIGARGSIAMHRGRLFRIASEPTVKIDSNGAGDNYAAGFLYGLSRGLDIQQCGDIASIIATEAVKVVGPKLKPEQWEAILPRIREIETRKSETAWQG